MKAGQKNDKITIFLLPKFSRKSIIFHYVEVEVRLLRKETGLYLQICKKCLEEMRKERG